MVSYKNILLDGSACSGDVVIPEGITIIAEDAFYWNRDITSVTFPDTVEIIGGNAFGYTTIKSVNMGNGVRVIGWYAFYGCYELEDVTLSSNLKIIDIGAFWGSSISELTLPEGLEIISRNAFHYSDLETIKIPDSVTKIEEGTFSYCRSLKTVILPSTIQSIERYAFDDSAIESLIIPSTKTEIDSNARIKSTYVDYVGNSGATTNEPTIYTFAGAKAIDYATENDINYELLDVENPVQQITATPANIEIHCQQQRQLEYTVYPENASYSQLFWSSEDETIAWVSNTGMVWAISEGTTTIHGETIDGSNITVDYEITVLEKLDEEITDTGNTDASEPEGDTPEEGSGDSGNSPTGQETQEPTAAPQSPTTPAGTGITPAADGTIKATALVLTANVAKAQGVEIKSTYKLAPKKKMTIKVAFAPENAMGEGLTFTSSKPGVAKVDSQGVITAGKKAGKTVITVTTTGGLQKQFTLQVMKKAVSKVKVSGKTSVKVNKTIKLKAKTKPGKKSAGNAVLWKSTKPTVATVDANGKVTGIKKGKVKIIAYATDGSGKKGSITIKVK
jgi:uncharacterized protein YjdB